MRNLGQHFQYLLHLDGYHPGPLFGQLPIRRESNSSRRSRHYRKKLKRATPPWADLEKIRRFYKNAKAFTRATGVLHTVDHVIPLKGEFVCGLHVHNNLQILTHEENMRKGNSFVDQLKLF